MRREDGTGEGGRVQGNAGASFGGSVEWEGAYRTVGVRARYSDLPNKCSARAVSDAGVGNREPALVPASGPLLYKEGRRKDRGRESSSQRRWW